MDGYDFIKAHFGYPMVCTKMWPVHFLSRRTLGLAPSLAAPWPIGVNNGGSKFWIFFNQKPYFISVGLGNIIFHDFIHVFGILLAFQSLKILLQKIKDFITENNEINIQKIILVKKFLKKSPKLYFFITLVPWERFEGIFTIIALLFYIFQLLNIVYF